jgi:hypothetical protein
MHDDKPEFDSMIRTRPSAILAMATLGVVLAGFGAAVHAQDDVPWLDPSAREIVSKTSAFYRALPTVACTAEVEVQLGEGTVDDRVAMRAIAVRPNQVSIIAIEPHGYFPTNQFISNGTELFEWSIRRRMFMTSPTSSSLEGLYERVSNRSAPNVPAEIFLALMSDEPIKNLIRLDVEPGMLRLVGEVMVEGVRCHEIVVNESGTRLCIRAESPNWVMRYENSPVTALPRYLPPGTKVTGPRIQVDFKSWSMSAPDNENWNWTLPEGSIQMATMHESAKGGPEDGYAGLTLAENRQGDAGSGDSPARGSNVGLRVGPNRNAGNQNPTGPKIGSIAPDVELVHLDGERTTLSKVRSGRPAALIFWLKKSKFSRTSIRSLLRVLKPLDESMAIIPIGCGEDAATVKAMIELYPEFAGSIVDGGAVVADAFSVNDRVAVVLLDRAGQVTDVHIGPNPSLVNIVTTECKMLLQEPMPAVDHENESVDD